MIRRPRAILALAIVAALAAAADDACAQAAGAIDPARVFADEIAGLARRMSDPAGDQDARDAAARRLLAIRRPEARRAVALALTDPASPGGRLAAARAVADDAPADPAFVDPLFVLLDATQPAPLIDAAATALGNFKMTPDVSTRLIALSEPRRPEPVRVAAVRALSAQIEKSAANRLVQLTGDASPAVSAAAIGGLQAFASSSIATAGEWADWWLARADVADDRFRLETLANRATRVEATARREDSTFRELSRGTLATLAATPRDAQADALAKLLASPVDATRLIAARQASDLATTGDLPAAARPGMRKLLGDPSAEVRLVAARAAQIPTNDAGAFDAIATQLIVEPDPRVRAELAAAAGVIGNTRAVPVLRLLLDDPSPAIAQAAATALAPLGATLARQSPADAAVLSTDLQRVLQSRGTPAAPQLREALVAALVPLAQRPLGPMFVRMLTDATARESNAIRCLAAAGLGAIGDPQASDVLVETLGDDNAAVRLAAVDALAGTSGGSFINAEPLRRRMDSANEPDARVRDHAWTVLSKLLDRAPREQLAAWAEQPLFKASPEKRLTLFAALERLSESAGDKDSQSAYLQQQGDVQMSLRPPEFAAATASYRKALDIARAQKRGGLIVALVESTLKSMLQGGDYAGASKFATDLFGEPNGGEYRSSVGFEFKSEAERLSRATTSQADALRLIQTALAMQPALPPQYQDQLAEIQKDVESRQRKQNDFGLPDWVRVYAVAPRAIDARF